MALRGSMRPPSDKSISHRALIFAALSSGTSRLENILPSADVRSTAKAIQKIGAHLKTEVQDGKPVILVEGIFAGQSGDLAGVTDVDGEHHAGSNADVAGEHHVGSDADFAGEHHVGSDADLAGEQSASSARLKNDIHIDCGNSGTTTRLLLGVLSGLGVHAYLDGDDSLRRRPMRRVTDPLEQMGAHFKTNDGCLPIEILPAQNAGQAHDLGASKNALQNTVQDLGTSKNAPQDSDQVQSAPQDSGQAQDSAQAQEQNPQQAQAHPATHLSPISYKSPHASAQVKSAILLAGLFAQGTTTISEPAKSRDHTEKMLPAFGVNIECDNLTVSVNGPAILQAHDVCVAADPSSAAFPAVAASCIKNSDIVLEDVLLNPTRIGAFELMRAMGCDIIYEHERLRDGEMVGNIHVRYSKEIRGVEVLAKDIPSMIDEIPVLAVLASRADGETIFRSCSELRVKESDRLAAIVETVNALGAQAFVDGDDLHIIGINTSGNRGSATNKAGTKTSKKVGKIAALLKRKQNKPQKANQDGALMLKTYHDHRLAMAWSVAGRIYETNAQLDDKACVNISWPSFYKDMFELEQL